jgi:hypothetical protein
MQQAFNIRSTLLSKRNNLSIKEEEEEDDEDEEANEEEDKEQQEEGGDFSTCASNNIREGDGVVKEDDFNEVKEEEVLYTLLISKYAKNRFLLISLRGLLSVEDT